MGAWQIFRGRLNSDSGMSYGANRLFGGPFGAYPANLLDRMHKVSHGNVATPKCLDCRKESGHWSLDAIKHEWYSALLMPSSFP